MADFFTSLKTPITNVISIVVNANNDGLVITDSSGYTTNTEPGAAITDFTNFRKLTVLDPNGITTTFSSLAIPPTLSPASTGNNTINFTFQTTPIDGVYGVTLFSVPTWNGALIPYQANDDIVYFGGFFYKCIADVTSATNPSSDPLSWEMIPETDITPTNFPKYATIQRIAITIELCGCIDDTLVDAFCSVDKDICSDLCDNDNFMKALKLKLIEMAVDTLVDREDWDAVTNAINLSKVLCECE